MGGNRKKQKGNKGKSPRPKQPTGPSAGATPDDRTSQHSPEQIDEYWARLDCLKERYESFAFGYIKHSKCVPAPSLPRTNAHVQTHSHRTRARTHTNTPQLLERACVHCVRARQARARG